MGHNLTSRKLFLPSLCCLFLFTSLIEYEKNKTTIPRDSFKQNIPIFDYYNLYNPYLLQNMRSNNLLRKAETNTALTDVTIPKPLLQREKGWQWKYISKHFISMLLFPSM
eukprot:TRINITY_DN19679_c0_g1_i3.p1 TRINITY_DN19679_c0_g1~~TRINITY_DN19679_c0_g1_i3.p1  ORF type:complete len:110 (-),score=6.70 TRINITY_DN19679_c0_g1_i3:49-378(-)